MFFMSVCVWGGVLGKMEGVNAAPLFKSRTKPQTQRHTNPINPINHTTVERVVEYRSEPEEAPSLVLPRPPADWPSQGAVDVKGLYVRYRPELPPVLKGLSFAVAPREKVGVVGRTGA